MSDVGSILIVGTDLLKITICLLEPVDQCYRLVIHQVASRQPGQRTTDQIAQLCKQLENATGRLIWDADKQVPFLSSDEPIRHPMVSDVFVTSSPKPRLKVWLAGLSRAYSLQSSELAIESGPALIAGKTMLSAQTGDSQLGKLFSTSQPDLVVLAGGFDSVDDAATYPIQQLGRLIGNALLQMAPVQRPTILYAGSRNGAESVRTTIKNAGLSTRVVILPNVRPHAQSMTPLGLIHGLTTEYWRGCWRTSEYKQMSGWMGKPAHITSLEINFARLVRAWMSYKNLDQLHGIYQAPDWWMHVWSHHRRETIEIAFSMPEDCSALVSSWPPPRLVSGSWPHELWNQPDNSWCDNSGLAPMIAAVGQIYPRAMMQVLETDVFQSKPSSGEAI